ncbi:hypothetical protein PXH69_24525 [Rhodococcus qingshengii]|uniref:Uncharacterized protein n=1 Tax=Rhodococcus qingshengii TaxID=334542 RepID=A0AAW6LKE8_RHOSG|nr:hypothetical protein [Rhodococcus qingshengii]MDE8648137.1 hypothetical protein [Rhodococcus qingshengii]
MPQRTMFVNRFPNKASRLSITPTQIRVTIAPDERHEREIMKAVDVIAQEIDNDLTFRGTFSKSRGNLAIHMSTRNSRNHVPGKRFDFALPSAA